MTVTAELHDGRRLEFPDGTDPAIVQQTVKRVLGAQQAAVSPAPTFVQPMQQQAPSEPSYLEKLAANPGMKILTRVASPFMAAGEYLPDSMGGQFFKENNQELNRLENEGEKGQNALVRHLGVGAEITGSAMSPAALKLMKMLPAATGATGVINRGVQAIGNMAKGAAGGAGIAAATPTGTEGGTVENIATGALVGGVLAPVIGGGIGMVQAANNFLRNLLAKTPEQVSTYLSRVIGNSQDRAAVAKELEAMRTGVVGERLNVGDLVDSVKTPELAGLVQMAAKREGTAGKYLLQEEANRVARAKPLEAIVAAGARGAKNRATTTAPMYEEAGKKMVPMDDSLTTLLAGDEVSPLVRKVGLGLDQEITNATVAGRQVQPNLKPGSYEAAYGLPEWSVAGPNVAEVKTPSLVRVGALHDLADSMSKKMQKLSQGTDSVTIQQAQRLKEAHGQLKNWLRSNSNEYKEADATYKALSEVPNQAAVVKPLIDALKSPAGAERQAAFANALKKAQEQFGFKNIDEVLSPTQARWVRDVESSIEREAKSQRLTAPQSALPQMEGKLDSVNQLIPGMVDRVVTGVKRVIDLAGKGLDKKAMDEVARLALSPKEMSAAMKTLTPDEQQTMFKLMLKQAKINGMMPALTAINQSRQQESP